MYITYTVSTFSRYSIVTKAPVTFDLCLEIERNRSNMKFIFELTIIILNIIILYIFILIVYI